MSKVVVHRRALHYLQRLSRPERDRVRAALLRLAEDIAGYHGVVQMAGEWKGYQRIRVGDIRIIFWYDKTDDILYVDHIGPRGDIYKG
jgi:mRNA interferase RelE/StbE